MFYELDGMRPKFTGSGQFVAESAVVIGQVTMMPKASVWFNAVVRADVDTILIGEGSNIQDGSVLHVDSGFPMKIGDYVTVGHKVMLHGCTIGSNSLIGINAVVLNGSVIGENCIIGANALLTENTVIPDGSVVMGSPGKIVKTLSEEQRQRLRQGAEHYVENAEWYTSKLKELSLDDL